MDRIPNELSGGPYFSAYCERYIRHTKGRWAGKPLVFEDWQRRFWWEAFEIDPATGLRIYTEVGLGLPRKNSKSTMASKSLSTMTSMLAPLAPSLLMMLSDWPTTPSRA